MISKDNKQRKKDTREQQNKNHIIIKKYFIEFYNVSTTHCWITDFSE